VIVFDFSMFTSIAIRASLGHLLTVRCCAVPHSGAALFAYGSCVRFFRAQRGKTAQIKDERRQAQVIIGNPALIP
jgi:hypothetical protein